MKHAAFSLSLLILLSLPIIYPFLQRGFFPTHDGGWAVVRLAEMHREIRDFQFPPRWSGYLNHGYGYPLFHFTYPMPYFLAEVVHLTKIGLQDSIKYIFVFSAVASTIGMFILSRKLWGNWGALISTSFYLYAPYRFVNLYIRGSIGESLAFIFFPLLFYLFFMLVKNRTLKYSALSSLFLAAFILTHNAMVVLFMPLLFFWMIFCILKNKNDWSKLSLLSLVTFVNGLLLSAFFWLPAIFEKKYIALSLAPLAQKSEHFLTLTDLFSQVWHFGTKPPFQIGLVQFISSITIFIIFIIFRKKLKNSDFGILIGIFCICAILMLFSFSLLFWQLPLFREIDFPWRMLGICVFLLALVSGGLGSGKYKKFIACILLFLVVSTNASYIQTQPREYIEDEYFATNDATTTSADELMPLWVFDKPTNKNTLLKSNHSEVLIQDEKSNSIQVQVTTIQDETLIFNKLYFPGWNAYLNGVQIPTSVEPNTGLISIFLPQGVYQLRLAFENTPIRLFANGMSIMGIIGIGVLWALSKRYHF